MEASIPELQAAMERGDLTSVQLVEFYLARIAAYDEAGPALNAFITVNTRARDEAAALDGERASSGPRGPLHGIPIVVKDNFQTTDMPMTAGSIVLKGFVPTEDAFVVGKLRDAGAIILGKTNMYEFAFGWTTISSLGGQTLNPYELGHDPGGSSGGTAVAVTANLAAAGFGTDTCGSVRYPAVLNDLYGLRPTEGLVSRAGVVPLSPTLDAVGPLARTVVDLAVVLDATAGVDPADPVTTPVEATYRDAIDPNGLVGRRVGIRASPGLSAEVTHLLTAAIDELRASGAEVVDIAFPVAVYPGRPFDEFDGALDAYFASMAGAPVRSRAELAAGYGAYPDRNYAGLSAGPPTSIDTDEYRASIAARPTFRDDVVALMDELDLDAILSPESARGAPPILAQGSSPWDCKSAPYGGLPALSMPMGFTAEGLPVGIELMGRPFSEPTLLSMAAGYEAHTSHRYPPPTAPALN